jgi:adenylate cyclase
MAEDPLVDELVELGVEREEAVRMRLTGRAPLAMVERLITGPTPYSREDLVRLAEVDPQVLDAWLTASGVGEEERFGEADLHEARQLHAILEVLSLDAVLRLARLRRMAAGQVALGDIGMIRDELLTPLVSEGADDVTIAKGLRDITDLLWPAAGEILVNAQRRNLLRLLRLDTAADISRSGRSQVDLGVGFVDLVGYTRLSAQVDPSGLTTVLGAFEARVFEVADTLETTTIAKFLGDAAMLVSTDPVELVAGLLEMVQPVEALEDAPLRGGMAYGPVTVREGDYFGDPVNTAARLTDAARPWTLLADHGLEDLLEGRFRLKDLRKLKLPGLGKRRPLVVRSLDDDEDDD